MFIIINVLPNELQEEASSQLKRLSRDMLQRLGSAYAQDLGYRDSWAMIAIKGGLSSLV